MKGLNKCQIIGHLGADPEVRYSQSGAAITSARVATSEKWKDRSGEPQERTEWHSVTFFGKLAEIAAEYLRKGSQVYVEGRLQTDKWQDRDGNDRWTTKLIANQLLMLGGKGSDRQTSAPEEPDKQPAADPGLDDDIPF